MHSSYFFSFPQLYQHLRAVFATFRRFFRWKPDCLPNTLMLSGVSVLWQNGQRLILASSRCTKQRWILKVKQENGLSKKPFFTNDNSHTMYFYGQQCGVWGFCPVWPICRVWMSHYVRYFPSFNILFWQLQVGVALVWDHSWSLLPPWPCICLLLLATGMLLSETWTWGRDLGIHSFEVTLIISASHCWVSDPCCGWERASMKRCSAQL
jgi:hypothetical protein